jgi:hypothetical protein
VGSACAGLAHAEVPDWRWSGANLGRIVPQPDGFLVGVRLSGTGWQLACDLPASWKDMIKENSDKLLQGKSKCNNFGTERMKLCMYIYVYHEIYTITCFANKHRYDACNARSVP